MLKDAHLGSEIVKLAHEECNGLFSRLTGHLPDFPLNSGFDDEDVTVTVCVAEWCRAHLFVPVDYLTERRVRTAGETGLPSDAPPATP